MWKTVCAALLLFAGQANAADKPLDESLTLNDFWSSFNQAADAMDIDFDFSKPQCKQETIASCEMEHGPELRLQAMAKSMDAAIDTLVLYYMPGDSMDNMMPWFAGIDTLVYVAEPGAEKADRGPIASEIVTAFGNDAPGFVNVAGDNAKYSVGEIDGIIVIAATKAD